MKHTSHSVIKSYLRNTTNNTFLHIILLLLEHIPLIITSMNAPLKLKYFFSNDITTPLHNVYTHPLLTFFPFRCPNPNITSPLTLTLFILLSFFLLFYHIFISIRAASFQFIFTNFYDLVYFRYGSFYPISIYFTLIFSTNEHSHYVVITIDYNASDNSSILKAYLNGELVKTTTAKGVNYSGAIPMTIGGSGSSSNHQYFTGSIDEIIAYSRVLTIDEIKANMANKLN